MSTLLSIDIGSSKMKFVLGRMSKKNIEIKKIFYAKTPAETVNNGEVLDIKQLREALLVEVQNNKLAGMKTVVTIQSSAYISREFSIPKIKEKDVEAALRFEIEQQMPIALDDYVMSYKELGFTPNADGPGTVKYLVGLMPQKIVSAYYQLIRSVKLVPAAMDVNSNAIEKLLDYSGSSVKEGILLLADIGNDAMDMTVFDNGIPKINRTVPIGGAEITRNISRAMGIDYEDAEIKKIQDVDILERYQIADAEITEITKSVIADWMEQLRRMTEFYMSRNHGKAIDIVYLYGGSSAIKRLDEYLTDNFGVKCSIMALPGKITLKQSSPAPIYTFFNAIGAIIRR